MPAQIEATNKMRLKLQEKTENNKRLKEEYERQ